MHHPPHPSSVLSTPLPLTYQSHPFIRTGVDSVRVAASSYRYPLISIKSLKKAVAHFPLGLVALLLALSLSLSLLALPMADSAHKYPHTKGVQNAPTIMTVISTFKSWKERQCSTKTKSTFSLAWCQSDAFLSNLFYSTVFQRFWKLE